MNFVVSRVLWLHSLYGVINVEIINVKDLILPKRKHLSIRKVENYDLRLKNGEKKRELEKDEVLKSLQGLGFDSAVLYKESGQPYLEKHSELFLSISHSRGWIAVYVAEIPVGIDIEPDNPKIIEGASYFVNEQEQQFIDSLRSLHIIWGVKEAFYKLKEGNISDLKNTVTVLKIEPDNTVQIEFEGKIYSFDYFQENGITVVLN